MKFFCNSCETQKDYDAFSLLLIEKWGYGIKRYCKSCRTPSPGVPDVYWDGKPEINLADDEHTGKPRVFLSKGQKAAYLKEKGLSEAGDRIHGAPVQIDNSGPKVDGRHEVRKALQHVKNMGSDRRRQEYLRIMKEGKQRYA